MPPGQDEIRVRTLSRAGCTEIFASVALQPGASRESALDRLTQAATRHSAAVVALDFHGLPASRFQTGRTPDTTWGAQLWAIAGVEVQPLVSAGRPLDTTFCDGQARYVRLNGLLPHDTHAPRAHQARQVFEQMEAALRGCQMSFHHVARTWFLNRNILDWYDEFNAVRNSFFAERGVNRGRLPASTGVGGQPADGAALVGGLLALQPLPDAQVRVVPVPSPRQGPAPDYGSSFSRAVELIAADHRRLLVSGTASIDERGRTLHPGDIGRQITATFDVVQQLLESRAMSWADTVRGVAYLRRAEDLPALQEYLNRQTTPPPNILPVVATVCRDELLFELEIDAAVSAQGA